MSATCSLSQEQKSVLVSTYHTLESMATYIRAVVPCVSGTDEQLLSGLVELAELCRRRLPQSFPELLDDLVAALPLADVRKKRDGL